MDELLKKIEAEYRTVWITQSDEIENIILDKIDEDRLESERIKEVFIKNTKKT